MKNINIDPLSTPVYLKMEGDNEMPEDKLYYLMTADGLFICRNHEWFSSCAPAKRGPADLAKQEPFLHLGYPKIPQALVERAVGFFHLVYEKDHWESAILLVWNRKTQQMELICPEQKANASAVKYEIPNLPTHLALIGDMHSHCDFSPEPSFTDEDDETNRPGLHVVVGHLKREPPDFYCVAVADGHRFKVVKHELVMEDYRVRDSKSVPKEWMAKITEKKYKFSGNWDGGNWGGYSGVGYGYQPMMCKGTPDDQKIIKEILTKFAQRDKCPTAIEVKDALFRQTKDASYLYCEAKGAKFVKAWPRIKACKKGTHEEVAA